MPRGARANADSELIRCLASGMTTEAAAKAAGVHVSTAFRRLRDPSFKGAVDAAKRDTLERTTAALTVAGAAAVAALISLLTSSSPTAKLGAAVKIIELGARLREACEFESRLSALEERLAQQPLRKVG